MTSSGRPSLTVHSKIALPLAINSSLLFSSSHASMLCFFLCFHLFPSPTSTELGPGGPDSAPLCPPRRLLSSVLTPPLPFPLRGTQSAATTHTDAALKEDFSGLQGPRCLGGSRCQLVGKSRLERAPRSRVLWGSPSGLLHRAPGSRLQVG